MTTELAAELKEPYDALHKRTGQTFWPDEFMDIYIGRLDDLHVATYLLDWPLDDIIIVGNFVFDLSRLDWVNREE